MKCYGILPMAGKGSRLQPIAFSKELYPVTYKKKHFAISEFSIKAMKRANVDEIKLIINPQKIDIAKYYAKYQNPMVSIYFHNSPSLPESCLFPIHNLHDEDICIFGLPDTLFTPADAYTQIRHKLEHGSDICLGLFKVKDGSKYDSIQLDQNNNVKAVKVKQNPPLSNWIWGIWGANVKTLKKLSKLIKKQTATGEKLLGVGFNELAQNKEIKFTGIPFQQSQYFDIGTMDAIVKVNSIIQNFQL